MTPRAAKRAALPLRFGALPLRLAALAAALLLLLLAVIAGGLLSAPGAGEASNHWTDYDTDDDGLIEISTLAQLNAIRHDDNGDGYASVAGYNVYHAAFSNRDTSSGGRMGCPSGVCAGYELMADLDFDTNGNGRADSDDAYWNGGAGWAAINGGSLGVSEAFNTVFEGNGHTISNLYISGTAQQNGLFGNTRSSAAIRNVGVKDATVSGSNQTAILVGDNRGAIAASWTSGSVSGAINIGGLAGRNRGAITACYSTASVTATATTAPNIHSSGLAGRHDGGSITASYYAGPALTTTATPANPLVGVGTATVTSSYWDTTTTGVDDDTGDAAPEGKTTAALQAPTAYGATADDIYMSWNVNVDGVTGNDDPWHFGSSAQYPILQHNREPPGIAAQLATRPATMDYDSDNDNLIDITKLAQLDAIRYDLDGNGMMVGAAAVKYLAAFPGLQAGMGCAAACTGYELRENLNFDTNGNGRTHTNGAGDAGDDYYNGGAGWNPIGGHVAVSPQPSFTATLEGNEHTISNLYINLDTSGDNDGRYVGLFAYTTGAIRNLGLVNPYVKNTRSGGGTYIYYGALAGVVGRVGGAVSRVYVSGGQVTGGQTNTGVNLNYAGCLAGFNAGTVSDSYATCDVAAIGGVWGTAGGLVGTISGTVLRSYAAGTVTSDYDAGGLAGVVGTSSGQTGRISDSYATGAVTTATAQHAGGLVGRVAAGADVIDSYATGAVSNSGNGTIDVGGLAGTVTGGGTTVTGSYATGAVATTGNNNSLGGLAGSIESSAMIASSYATGAVSAAAAASSNNNLGGLLGRTDSGGTTVLASYATGRVSTSGGSNNNLGGLVGETKRENTQVRATYAAGAVSASGGSNNNLGGLVGHVEIGSGYARISASYASGAISASGGGSNNLGGLAGGATSQPGVGSRQVFTNTYWDNTANGTGQTASASQATGGTPQTTTALQMPTEYAGTIYAAWNIDVDDDTTTGDVSGNDDPWHFGAADDYPVLKYDDIDVGKQRLAPEAGPAQQVYSGARVTLDGSGSRALNSSGTVNYAWSQTDTTGRSVTLSGGNTARPTFTAPVGLTTDTVLEFTLAVSKTGTPGVTKTDTVTVTVIAVRSNQLLSLALADPEGDAVALGPPFVSGAYEYRASVANQIASVTVTPRILPNSTMTLNGRAVASGAAVEVPLKYRGNEIVIVVTPPEPEPSETMDGETTDETVEETPCSVENDGVKPCTYTVTVRRAVPPRLAFVPRSLTIDEGSSGTYTVELDTRILTGAVTIAIASDHPAVTVSPTEVTLKPLDMAPRTITVTAAADDDRDDENLTITHTANGAHYYDVIATVGVTVNDTTPEPDPELSVSATTLNLAEGGTGSYTVALATEPDGNVSVAIVSDNDEVTTSPAELAFTARNWSTAQSVTVRAASDADAADDTAALTHTASGGRYSDAPAVSVAVSVADDDTAGLAITPTVLNLSENGISAYIVSLTAQPSGNVTVSIASDNPDVTVRPTALTFTPTNWATPQAVLVIARADDGGGDELATLRMTARGGGYAGQTGQVMASVDDTLAPLPAGSVTTGPDAPAGVGVYGPPGTTARATVAAADDTPTMAAGAGFSIGSAVAVSVSDAPDDGLEICLPVSAGLRAEVNSALILTLLRYAGGIWTELSGARDLGNRVCAGGVTGEAAYAAAYALRPGTVLDLAASVGDDPGTIELSWTPPAAGTSQVAVVVNVADDTDYCLDTLPGLDASTYTCAGRTAGQTYVALLIVLLPDGGYTLANIVRFDLPAAGSQ